jgi:quercetin dioxygenase-like cupin family protein
MQAVAETASKRRISHVPAGTGNKVGLIGEQFTFKVTQAETNGAFSIIEMLAFPGGGPPFHTHPSAETFVILEGEFEFTGLDDGKPFVFRATAGDTVFIPGGDPHTYQAVGESPGRTMLVFTPGREMESFFAEAGFPLTDESASTPPPDFPAMIALAEKHGMVFLPPSNA